MSKLLSARDLLELVRQNEAEDRQETELVTNADTLGRRIYPGTTTRRPGRAFIEREQRPAQPRGPRNTQLIEAVRPPGAAQPPPGPPPAAAAGPTRRGTIQMRRPTVPDIGRPVPAAGPDSGPMRDDARTLEMVLPRPPTADAKAPALGVAQAPVAQATPKPAMRADVGEPVAPVVATQAVQNQAVQNQGDRPARSLSPAQPLRKVSMGVWGRASEAPSQPPPAQARSARLEKPEARAPLGRAEPAAAAPAPTTTAAPAPPAAVAKASGAAQPAAPPVAESAPLTPPRSSVASMFSWVTQRADWAPPQETLESKPPPAPVPPLAVAAPVPMPPPPPEPPARVVPAQAPESDRSIVPSEPIALNSEETLVLVHYDQALSIDSLAERTGLTEFRVSRVVDNLRKRGVLEDAADSAPTPLPDTMPTGVASGPVFGGAAEKRPAAPHEPSPRRVESSGQRAADTDLPAKAVSASPFAGTPLGQRGESRRGEPVSGPLTTRDAPPPSGAGGELDSQPTLLELELDQINQLSADALRRTDEYAFPDAPADQEQTVVDNGSHDAGDLPATVAAQQQFPAIGGDLPAIVAAQAQFPAISPRPDGRALGSSGLPDVGSPTPPIAATAADDSGEVDSDDADDSATATGGAADSDADSANALAHYETVLSKINPDERAKLASTTAVPIELYAFCFDREPQVMRSLWQNINITHGHARFAAFNHRTAAGLDLIAQRNEFLKDPATQRRLIRNPMISETLLRRILVPKRLLEIYKLTLDRDAAERTRASARGYLRNKFATTEPEDRMELIWKTEGRALASLSGLSIDSKTAALICGRQIVSVMLVQSFTRFAATPPSVISHFLKQALVKRQVHLRNALLKHPNCPSDAKRAF